MWGISRRRVSRTWPYSSVEAGRRRLGGGRGISSCHRLPPRMRKHSRKPLAPKKLWREGLRRHGGDSGDSQRAEILVCSGQQLSCQPPAPAVRVGGHGVEVGRPVFTLSGEDKGGVKPGGHGLDHSVLLQHHHPVRAVVGVVEVVDILVAVPEGQLPQLPLGGDVLRDGGADGEHSRTSLVETARPLAKGSWHSRSE